jgi:hypothetical protein
LLSTSIPQCVREKRVVEKLVGVNVNEREALEKALY